MRTREYGGRGISLDRRSIRQRSVDALAKACLEERPGVSLDEIGYLPDYRDALVADVSPASFVADLEGGAGQELQGKFLAPHSSSALAVNSFGWFAGKPGIARIADHRELDLVGFEKKFPTGLARAQPPHLDVVLASAAGVVAVESKCLEYLSPKASKFSARYRDEIVDERRSSPWYAEMLRILDGPISPYRHLDVAQLIKHAFGLSYLQRAPVTLVYLWWEPANAGDFPALAAHRREIAHLARQVEGSSPVFLALSYDELWTQWVSSGEPELRAHARRLRKRYIREI